MAAPQGLVTLKDLKINPDAFRALGLPVNLTASHVGEIVLDIPFTDLKSKPIIVTIRNVLISLSPDPECDKHTMEKLQLAAHESRWNEAKLVDVEDQEQDGGFVDGYIQKITDNIQGKPHWLQRQPVPFPLSVSGRSHAMTKVLSQ